MKKSTRNRILIALAIVVVVVVAGGVVLVANLGRIVNSKKAVILRQAESQLGRRITVGDIGVAVWPEIGVSLDNVTVSDDTTFSREPFLSVGDVRVNVKLLPLLHREIEVKRLVLDGAKVQIVRDRAGRLNIDTIGGATSAAAGTAAPGGGGSTVGGGGGGGAAALPFVLAFADVHNGSVRYVDRALGIDHTVSDIDFTARNVSLGSEVSFELAAAVVSDAQDVHVHGALGPIGRFEGPEDLRGTPVDVSVDVGPVAAARLRSLVSPDPRLDRLDALKLGDLEVHLTARGTLDSLKVDGATATLAALGVSEPNVTATISAGPVDALTPAALAPRAVPLEGKITVAPIPLAALRVAAGAAGKAGAAADVVVEGDASAKASFHGTLADLALEASLDATAARLAVGQVFAKAPGAAMTASFQGTLHDSTMAIVSADLRFMSARATAKGTVAPGAADVTVTLAPTDVAPFAKLVPALAPAQAKGTVAGEVRVRHRAGASRPRIEGTLTLRDGGARLAQLPKPITGARATVHVTSTDAKVEDVALTVGESTIHAGVDVPTLSPPTASYSVTSDLIHRYDFQPPPPKPGKRPEVLRNVVAKGTIRVPAPGRIQHRGTVTSSGGTLSDIDYSNLKANIVSRGDTLRIESFTAKTLDGSVEGEGSVLPTAVPPQFDIRTHVRQVDLAKVFQYKFPVLTRVLSGRIDLDLDIAGSGTTWDTIQKTLHGSGGAVVIEGALLNANLADALLSGLASNPLVPAGFAQSMRAKHPKLFASNETAFKNLKGKVTIQDGKVETGDLALQAPDFAIKGGGWFSFDKTMNMNANVVLSPGLTRDIVAELPVAKYLTDAQGRLEIPLMLSGDVLKPRVTADAESIAKRLQQGAVQQGVNRLKGTLQEQVKDLFGRKKAPADTTKQQ